MSHSKEKTDEFNQELKDIDLDEIHKINSNKIQFTPSRMEYESKNSHSTYRSSEHSNQEDYKYYNTSQNLDDEVFVETMLPIQRKWWEIPDYLKDLLLTLIALVATIFTIVFLIGSIAWYIFAIHRDGKGIINLQDTKTGSNQEGNVYLAKGINFAVASDHRTCSHIGLNILKMGGNSVDSAIATCFCIGIMNSFSSGIGGGTVMLISEKSDNKASVSKADDDIYISEDGIHYHVINAREKAPLSAHKDMYKDNIKDAQIGSKAIGVPGEILGMYTAWRKHGKLPWHYLVEPSIPLAKIHKVSKLLASKLKEKEADIFSHPHLDEFRKIFAPNGKLLQEGDYVRNENLAKSLRLIADEGAYTFYNGTLSKLIVQDIQDLGGLITEADLAAYTVKEEKPLCTHFFGHHICSSNSEISGGACSIMAYNILEQLYKRIPIFSKDMTPEKIKHRFQHYTIEAMKWIFSHRMNLGDPEFVDTRDIVNDMTSKSYASRIVDRISDDHTEKDFKKYAPLNHPNIFSSVPNGGTTHLSVVDSENRTVAMTSTINLYFGSMVLGARTGIIFNDEMDDFSTPGQYNGFNIPPSEANFISPGKRPLSSMSPTIVYKNGELYMSIGASGGPRIITATLQAVLNGIIFDKELDSMISSPRFHHQLLPPVLYVDKEFDEATKKYFESLGHTIQIVNFENGSSVGVVQGIVVKEGKLYASSDWRKPAGRSYAI